jgi:hypothetical protein
VDGSHDMEVGGSILYFGWSIMVFNGEDLVDCGYDRLHELESRIKPSHNGDVCD